MAGEQYQEKNHRKSLSRASPHVRKQEPAPPDERETFNKNLIKEWCNCFTVTYHPVNLHEQEAMDWMLYSAGTPGHNSIKSPIAYLKTIARKGFPTQFPSFEERKRKSALPSCLDISVEQRWQNLNPANRQLFIEEARDRTDNEDLIEKTAFNIFLADLAAQKHPAARAAITKPHIKSVSEPRFEPC
jgi:hypothetical protein